jgi:hypothetical protein
MVSQVVGIYSLFGAVGEIWSTAGTEKFFTQELGTFVNIVI